MTFPRTHKWFLQILNLHYVTAVYSSNENKRPQFTFSAWQSRSLFLTLSSSSLSLRVVWCSNKLPRGLWTSNNLCRKCLSCLQLASRKRLYIPNMINLKEYKGLNSFRNWLTKLVFSDVEVSRTCWVFYFLLLIWCISFWKLNYPERMGSRAEAKSFQVYFHVKLKWRSSMFDRCGMGHVVLS